MAFNIGAVVSVQGEREFNAAMNSMKQNMKYVSAEANAAMSVFAENERSVESLTAKNDGLKKALDVQRQGMKDIRATMDKLVSDGLDPTSEKYKQLKANLDNTTAAANKTEQEIKENEDAILGLEQAMTKNEKAMDKSKDAMGDLGQESKGLGSAVQTVANKFGITLPEEMTKSIDGLGGMSTQMLALVGVCAAATAAIAKVEQALFDLTMQQASWADDIMTNASISGIAADSLQEIMYAAELMDVSFETISGSMTKMIRSMNSARAGGNEVAETYKALGIRVTGVNGELRNSNEVFYEVIDKLGKMKNETERDAAAMQIFGKSARELNPLIELTSAGIRDLNKEAQNVRFVVLTDEELNALGAVDDKYQTFLGHTIGLKNAIALGMAPAVERLWEGITKVVDSLIDLFADSGLVQVFAALMDIVSALSPIFQVLFDTLGTGSSGPLKALAVALAIVADALTIVINLVAIAIEGIRQFFNLLAGKADTTKLDQYAKNLNNVFSSGGATAKALGLGPSTGYVNMGGGLALASASNVSLANVPRGINTEAGLRAYERRLANDQRMADGQRAYGDTFNVTIDAKNVREFNDVVRYAQSARQQSRARG
jgi:methyl-accepting chemotaxis protein